MPEAAPTTSPEPWVVTPEFLQDRARRVHASLLNLNDAITKLAAAHRLDPNGARWKAWKRSLEAFGKWYADAGITTWLWSGTAATLDAYEADVIAWQRWLRETYPDTAPSLAPAPMLFNPDGRPKSDVPWWAIALGAGGALALVYVARK